MSRTCMLETAIVEHDGDEIAYRDWRVCGKPAVVELTVGPRPFRYFDVCAPHSELHRADDAGITSHPIPQALR